MPRPSPTWTPTLRRKWSAFAATLLVSASTSFAQPSDPAENEPAEIEAVEIQKGEAAPFPGQLVTHGLAAELAVGIEHCLEKKKVQLQDAERMCKLRVKGAKSSLETENRALEGKVEVLEKALEEAQAQREVPFYEDPRFVAPAAFAAGVAVAAAATFGAIWAVGQLRPVLPPAEPQPE